MSVPFLTRSNCEAIELAFWVGQLNTIARFEEARFRHMRILGESLNTVGIALYRLRDGTVTPLP